MEELLQAFKENTAVTKDAGRCQINCKKGLWGVDCPTYEMAIPEALHYFQQYYGDGEYDSSNATNETR